MSEQESAQRRWGPLIGVALWIGLVGGTAAWAHALPFRELHLGNVAPLFGRRRLHVLTNTLVPAVAVAVAVALVAPRIAATMKWRQLLVVAWTTSAGWAVALAASDGFGHIAEPLTTRDEYLRAVPAVGGSLHTFVRQFASHVSQYPTHVKGHGPLALLMFYGLAKLGLPQPTVAAAVVIAVGTSAVVAVAVTVRLLCGEAAARRALPFLVLMPAVLWIATSADAVFLGVSAWGVATLTIATARSGRIGFALGVLSGLLFGATLYMSYGLLVLAPLPLAVVVLRRKPQILVSVIVGLLIVFLAFTAEGFSYIAGFNATHRAWVSGVGPARSRPYFLVANIAELALCVGPVAAVGLGSLRSKRLTVVVGAVVVAMLASDASGFVRGEAERIWLPFAPWLIAAIADVPLTKRRMSILLCVQALAALVIQGVTISPW